MRIYEIMGSFNTELIAKERYVTADDRASALDAGAKRLGYESHGDLIRDGERHGHYWRLDALEVECSWCANSATDWDSDGDPACDSHAGVTEDEITNAYVERGGGGTRLVSSLTESEAEQAYREGGFRSPYWEEANELETTEDPRKVVAVCAALHARRTGKPLRID